MKESQSQMEDVEETRSMKVRNKRSRQLNVGVDNTTRAAFMALFRGCAVSIGPPPSF